MPLPQIINWRGTLFQRQLQAVIDYLDGNAKGGDLVAANNLSDVGSAATSRTNLGLGTAATSDTGDFATAAQGALADSASQWGEGSLFDTTSGTAFDQAIPADVRLVRIKFSFVSLSGTDDLLVQLGSGGSIETTGYFTSSSEMTTAVTTTNSGSGMVLKTSGASSTLNGVMTLVRHYATSNQSWQQTHSAWSGVNTAVAGGGGKFLSGDLDSVRITRTGTNTFDNGTVSVEWEF